MKQYWTHVSSKKMFDISNILHIKKKPLLLFCALTFIGFVNIFSASIRADYIYFSREIIYLFAVLPMMLIVVLLNPRYFIYFAYILYASSIIVLASVFAIGDVSMGARRWINLGFISLQPSEFVKLTLVLAIARYYHFTKDKESHSIVFTIVPILLTVIPAAMTIKQPDLGSGIVILATGMILIFLNGVRWKYIIIAGIILGSAMPLIWHKMHDYQRQRIITFVSPEADPLGAGYNITQSKIAVGSGGIFGKGFGNNSQSQLSFLPESHTDFAFTVLAEEFGFMGSLVLLTLYGLLILYGYKIAYKSESHFARVLALGISSIYFLHVSINIAMIIGLMPIVGIPLPFLSYGGSIFAITSILFAILMNLDINYRVLIPSSNEDYMER